jgi:hypothetical protein
LGHSRGASGSGGTLCPLLAHEDPVAKRSRWRRRGGDVMNPAHFCAMEETLRRCERRPKKPRDASPRPALRPPRLDGCRNVSQVGHPSRIES